MTKVYLRGSSLICALGNNKFESLQTAQKIDDDNYKRFFQDSYNGFNFFKINQSFPTQTEKFYTLLKEVIFQAIKDANLEIEEQKELMIFLGSTSMTIALNEEQSGFYYEEKSPSMLQKVGYGDIGTFVEELIDSKHKTIILQTACTSASNGISYATRMIQEKKIKRALVIGFELFNQSTYKGFESLMLLSKEGIYRPFDQRSDGLILGESCSAVILDTVQATKDDFEILSSHITFDNHSITGSNPNGEATYDCMKNSLQKANLKLEQLTAIKAHATGSENSNLSEINAINHLFKDASCSCDVVVLKPFLGHTLGACGTSETVLLCEFVKQGFLPKTLNYQQKYQDSLFEPLKEKRLVNTATILFQYIGFGGSNSSFILSNQRD